ncbi:hypothetical protein [Cytobacillus horneckiae]|uniref:hypothetical protein n=1 Tax=Cytobacillus horneckiae TaxID=549687 RepID=UPI003D9A62C6
MDSKKRKRLLAFELKLEESILKSLCEGEVVEEEVAYVLSKLSFSYSSVVIRAKDNEDGRD